MPTPNSSATSYAQPSDLIIAYDANQVGDLVNDDKTRATASQITTVTSSPGPYQTTLAKLKWASGQVEAACLVAGRYQPSDLAALTGMLLALLIDLVCDLAYWKLTIRRYPGTKLTDQAKGALDLLSDLRFGQRIFGWLRCNRRTTSPPRTSASPRCNASIWRFTRLGVTLEPALATSAIIAEECRPWHSPSRFSLPAS